MRILKKTESNMNITINSNLLKLAKIHANMQNISLKEYIANLIKINTRKIKLTT